jgi:hypothetical protein
MMKQLILEVNAGFVEAETEIAYSNGSKILFTPPLDGDYWAFRVQVSEGQAVVGFPKFSTIGIGFQHEEDWNTNLPYTCDTEMIYKHIRHNKGDARIDKATCIRAIEMVQQEASEHMSRKEKAK